MNIIEKYYKDKNAKNYEEGRSKSSKWQFEEDTLEAVIRNIKDEIDSIIDAPVGTGRFIPLYKKELKGKKIHLLDYSDDMLKISSKRKGLFNSNKFELLKHDLINNPLNIKADLCVCYRFLNLFEWKDSERAVENLLKSTKKYAVFSIRLVDDKFKGNKFIENKIYLQLEKNFAEIIDRNNFHIIEVFDFTDDREGNYKVLLCQKQEQIFQCSLAKSGRFSFVYSDINKPKEKFYQTFNSNHADFINTVTNDNRIRKYFPKIIKIQDEYINSEWIDGKEATSEHYKEVLNILFQIQSLEIEKNSSFDYVEDLIIPRFYNLHPVIGKDFCDKTVEIIIKNSEKYLKRISHPDLTPRNIIQSKSGLVVIDNELLCNTRHHRIDILNMSYNNKQEFRNLMIQDFLNHEKISYNQFSEEFEYLNALWLARMAGSLLMKCCIEDVLNIVNDFNQDEWILPFDYKKGL